MFKGRIADKKENLIEKDFMKKFGKVKISE